MDIQKAISYWQKFRAECFEMLKEGTENDKRTAEEQIPVCDDTITVLREQAEREKGRSVCNKGVKITYSPEDDLYPYAAEFCPHCGRRLK